MFKAFIFMLFCTFFIYTIFFFVTHFYNLLLVCLYYIFRTKKKVEDEKLKKQQAEKSNEKQLAEKKKTKNICDDAEARRKYEYIINKL